MSEQAELFVASIIDAADAKFLVTHPEIGAYMGHNEVDASLYALVDHHLKTYGKLPGRATLEKEWGQSLPKAVEPAKFYFDQLRPMHIRRTLQKAAVDAQAHIKSDPEKALKLFEETVYQLRTQDQGLAMMDLRQSKDYLMKHLAAKWSGDGFYGLGWPTFDAMSGGIMPGDVIVFVGKTGLGKTMLLLSRALYLWKVLKLKVLFVSMEMSLPQILERAASMYAHVPLDYLKHGLFPNLKVDFKSMLTDALDELKSNPSGFFFVDGNLSVDKHTLLRLCNQLQPDAVCVDAAYLLEADSKRMFEGVIENVRFLKKGIAPRHPVLATYQFNKEGSKVKSGQTPTVQDIGGGMEIGNTATVVFGLFQDDGSPETIHKRRVNILKGRNGETGQFYTRWDFLSMNFDEVTEDKPDQELEGIV